ncbi:trypsin-4-like [Aphidius gifuensis]|uniref:trypsin-4-like n=1 Tax=Aphidius gifuensis TaxID=684658 RepID=UPI001CDC7B83|nr:trypsin-4-like [Aphidius gifuensis]
MAFITSHPSTVSILYRGHHLCTGNIINEYDILTTASCVTSQIGVVYGNLQIYSGTSRLNFEEMDDLLKDVHLLKNQLILSASRQVLSMRDLNNIHNERRGTVIGWGKLPDYNFKHLKTIAIKFIKQRFCSNKIKHNLHNSQECFHPLTETSTVTQGDGGSRVTIFGYNKLFGIVSLTSTVVTYQISIFTISNGKKSSKITGGNSVSITNFPHQVSIRFMKYHVCAGSIVSDKHILTTASCISAENPRIIYANLEILSGTEDRIDENGAIHQVKLIIFHEDYKGIEHYWQNDLAILILTTQIVFTSKQRPGCLPINNLKSKDLWLSGWGGIPTLADPLSRYLQGLRVRDLSRERCHQYYEPFIPIGLHEGQSCAAPETFGALITPGDGGSPLTAFERVIGMVSINIPTLENPVMYTRVFLYRHFINYIIVNY